MRRAFKYRIYPNRNQLRELEIALETHRRLYNDCLDERKARYEAEKVTVKYAAQSARFKAERATNPFYARLNFSSAQATMRRLDKGFVAFFRRVKAGEKPGYPRFRGRDRYDSIEYPAYGDGIRLTGDRLRVQHVGVIRVKLHREVQGAVKTVTLKRVADKWYVVLSCDLGDVAVEPSTNPPVGIDVGLKSFLSKSDGSKAEPNPRYLKTALPELRRKGRAVARKRKGGKNRRKAVKKLAGVHARVRNLRAEHHHQVALKLVRRYGLIAVESLSIRNMLKNDRLSRAISDVAWGNFLLTLRSKAESAGVAFVEVNARGTSQECPDCAKVVPKDLSQRWHSCECGCSLDRDEASARVILARGLLARTGPVGARLGLPGLLQEAVAFTRRSSHLFPPLPGRRTPFTAGESRTSGPIAPRPHDGHPRGHPRVDGDGDRGRDDRGRGGGRGMTAAPDPWRSGHLSRRRARRFVRLVVELHALPGAPTPRPAAGPSGASRWSRPDSQFRVIWRAGMRPTRSPGGGRGVSGGRAHRGGAGRPGPLLMSDRAASGAHDPVAVRGHAPGGIARVDHQARMLDDPRPVVGRVVGRRSARSPGSPDTRASAAGSSCGGAGSAASTAARGCAGRCS